MIGKPPCGDCMDRWVSESDRCHTTCGKYHQWLATREASKSAIRAERKKESDVRIAHKPKIRLRKRRR